MYRSPVKEWQVSWFVFGTITLNGTDTVVNKYCRTVRSNVFTFLSSRFTLGSGQFKLIVPKTNQLTCHSFTGDLYVSTYLHRAVNVYLIKTVFFSRLRVVYSFYILGLEKGAAYCGLANLVVVVREQQILHLI